MNQTSFVHALLPLQRLRYFLDPNNLVEWVLYVSTAVFIAPVLFHYSDCLNLEAGAVAVFLAWFNCLLFLQRYTALNQTESVIFAIILVLFKTTAFIKKNHQSDILFNYCCYEKFRMLKYYLRRLKNIKD